MKGQRKYPTETAERIKGRKNAIYPNLSLATKPQNSEKSESHTQAMVIDTAGHLSSNFSL